jgi:hypothetical protein
MPKKKLEEAPAEVKTPSTTVLADRENWVILDFKLLNWKYMNFQMKVFFILYYYLLHELFWVNCNFF